jgi:hypothetical protein
LATGVEVSQWKYLIGVVNVAHFLIRFDSNTVTRLLVTELQIRNFEKKDARAVFVFGFAEVTEVGPTQVRTLVVPCFRTAASCSADSDWLSTVVHDSDELCYHRRHAAAVAPQQTRTLLAPCQ